MKRIKQWLWKAVRYATAALDTYYAQKPKA